MTFEVNRTDFRETRVVEDPTVDLAPGQLRLAVERFAFTANNISYAVGGDMLDYWGFFPTEAPWGRLPVMGLAAVTESTVAGIETGGRYFGFYPMAEELIIDAKPSSSGFSDVGTHRSGHAAAYTSFLDISADPTFRDDRTDEFLLVRGLFMTSFLIDDFLADNGFHEATQTLITSASSKTSIALGHCLGARNHHRVGLTSARNRSFVEGLSVYDQVVTYDEIGTLDPTTKTVVVDMAGNGDLRSTIHHHFGGSLRYSCQVGATHWEQLAGEAELPGPEPEFFFAPGQMAKRDQDWGSGELARRVGTALVGFLEDAPRWITVQHSAGPSAVGEVYDATIEGAASPEIGHILSLSPTAFAS